MVQIAPERGNRAQVVGLGGRERNRAEGCIEAVRKEGKEAYSSLRETDNWRPRKSRHGITKRSAILFIPRFLNQDISTYYTHQDSCHGI